ncbi:hypothetical protein KVR01_003121 [Diaporthe batatas]|uniref:uncharacterized protein n=1 Tax=Diaporthe batatas TaxID=748121 RepID=UPI001D04CC07|nr:uncharacterized protein KVR01_003121 [Diaporthe batatas]KAG8167432.1 hypothetical protein KVR01_003121 [Diaporthe batatas]
MKSSSKPRPADGTKSKHGWRFWAVFPGLCFSVLLVGLDTSIVTTALPTIVNSLHSGALYVWVVNGYFLSTAAVQPVFGQASDIFGRRNPLLIPIALFTLGSGMCGGASDTAMLIAGRIIQGLGGGGLFIFVDIIVADLVPLRERQKYMALVTGTFALGTFIGPIIGGVIATNQYILALGREGSLVSRLGRVDLSGNFLLMASVVAVLIGLTWGGTLYPWSSFHVLVPLLIGVAGLCVFYAHQKYFAKELTMPLRVYSNTTSLLSFVLSFLHGIAMSWLSFFLPVYFQVLLEASPLQSGVNLLAIIIPLMPAGIAGGLIIAKTGRYKPTMIAGHALLALGAGLLVTLDAHSSTAEWVIFQIIAGVGAGLAHTAALPAIQAPLAEADVAVATASWAFVRSFGSIWGAATPATIFNSRVDRMLYTISDTATRELLQRGGAYEHATVNFMKAFNETPELKKELVDVYTAGIKEVWQVLIAFCVISVPIACVLHEVPLRKELVTEFGLKDEDEGEGPHEMSSGNNATESSQR